MFREMRRKNQQLSESECLEILNTATSGVLALNGDDGYPYAVPMSYVYNDGKLIFHGAKRGHRFDSVQRSQKASFCVTAADNVLPEEYTTAYKSVIAFGKIRAVTDKAEIMEYTDILASKYNPHDSEEHRKKAIQNELPGLCIFELTVEHITGKQAKELLK